MDTDDLCFILAMTVVKIPLDWLLSWTSVKTSPNFPESSEVIIIADETADWTLFAFTQNRCVMSQSLNIHVISKLLA